MRAVYQTYASQLGVSYSQFTRYVNQHIQHGDEIQEEPPCAID